MGKKEYFCNFCGKTSSKKLNSVVAQNVNLADCSNDLYFCGNCESEFSFLIKRIEVLSIEANTIIKKLKDLYKGIIHPKDL